MGRALDAELGTALKVLVDGVGDEAWEGEGWDGGTVDENV